MDIWISPFSKGYNNIPKKEKKNTVKLTLRYICPCPPEVPFSNTDWLMVDAAEAPTGWLLGSDEDVIVVCQITVML